MKQRKRYKMNRRTAAVLSGILASSSMVLYPSATQVFAADSSDVVIPVEQVFSATGKGADEASGSFSYELVAETAGAPLPESVDHSSSASSYTFSLQKDSSMDLSLSYAQEGEYHYTLSCSTKDGSGYRVDTQDYAIEVNILPANEGGVRLGGVYIKDEKGDKKAKAVFSHSYNGDGFTSSDSCIAVDPPVKKRVKGTPSKSSEFSFLLESKKEGQPMPEGSENGRKLMHITGEGEGEFGEWTYTEPGTYVYDITEVNAGEEGYEYDKAVYTITDTVTKKDEGLAYTRSITVDGEAYTQDTFNFVNEYTGGGESGTGENRTTTPEGGSSNNEGTSNSSDSSRITRLGGKDTGDTISLAPFIVIPASAAGIATALVLALRKSKKAK